MILHLPPIITPGGKALLVISGAGGEDYINEKLLSGRDGEIILKLFMDAGLKSKEFSYATAIDNRDAHPNECFPRLLRTVETVKPEYIIAMGNVALTSLTKKSGIKKYRGDKLNLHEIFKFECPVYPTYSVQDLRNVPTFKRTIIADLRNTQKQDSSDEIQFSYWR